MSKRMNGCSEQSAGLANLFGCSSSTPLQNSTDGKLGMGEFATLWKKVQRYLVRPSIFPPCGQVRRGHWVNRETASLLPQSIYKKNDSDNSGTMSTPEMRVAFRDAGQFLLLLLLLLLVSLWMTTSFYHKHKTLKYWSIEAEPQIHRTYLAMRFVHSDFPEAYQAPPTAVETAEWLTPSHCSDVCLMCLFLLMSSTSFPPSYRTLYLTVFSLLLSLLLSGFTVSRLMDAYALLEVC